MGFKLPPSNAFTGFTTTGEYVSTLSQINGEWDSSLKGWNFYTDSSKNKTIFFPASGYRDYSNGGAKQRWQLRLLMDGGSVLTGQRSQPGLRLVVRVPVELLRSGVRVWGAFFPRIGSVATVSVSLDYFPYGFKAVGIVPAKPVDFYRN